MIQVVTNYLHFVQQLLSKNPVSVEIFFTLYNLIIFHAERVTRDIMANRAFLISVFKMEHVSLLVYLDNFNILYVHKKGNMVEEKR